VLPGSGTAPAEIEVIYQSRATRLSRALLILGLAVVIAPLLFFIPPHFLWPVVGIAAGAYLARRYWKGHYYVVEFEGSCPRCGAALELEEGQRIGRRHGIECYSCHRQPELVLDDPDG
jgi:hypothetical protein